MLKAFLPVKGSLCALPNSFSQWLKNTGMSTATVPQVVYFQTDKTLDMLNRVSFSFLEVEELSGIL